MKLSLAVTIAVAAALRFGPPTWGEKAKSLVRDALPKLHWAWESVSVPTRDWLQSQQLLSSDEKNKTTADSADNGDQNSLQVENDRLQQSLDDAELRIRQLQAQIFAHQEHIARLKRDGVSPFPLHLPAPDTHSEVITARLIGAEQDPLGRTQRPLAAAGSQQGVQTADLAIEVPAARGPGAIQQVAAQEMILDQGSEVGVEADQPVFAGRRIVGRVKQTGLQSCTLLPVDDLQYRGQAQILRETTRGAMVGPRGVFCGKGKGKATLEHVPIEQSVNVNDLVFTTGQDAPDDVRLYYGRIAKATIPAGATSWEIEVQIPTTGPAPTAVQLIRAR